LARLLHVLGGISPCPRSCCVVRAQAGAALARHDEDALELLAALLVDDDLAESDPAVAIAAVGMILEGFVAAKWALEAGTPPTGGVESGAGRPVLD
jgi:hypothetical protein